MLSRLIHLEPDAEESLQSQLRRKLVEGILVGAFAPGSRLPSSRELAKQLAVSRNTVVLVYQALTDEGYIISKQRSGIYVNSEINQGKVAKQIQQLSNHSSRVNSHRFKGAVATTNATSVPHNWRNYLFPFIDGKFDSSLYPVKEWREATSRATATKEIKSWSEIHGGDDPMLIDEIRTKVLPRRGIQAAANEILITSGAQQALYMITSLFFDQSTTVAVEEPGYPEMRELLNQRAVKMHHQGVDDQGMIVDGQLQHCDAVYVTPSHQTPTSITMSMGRRTALLETAIEHDLLIIEDDFEFESNFLGKPHPALRSLDTDNRVVYTSCLSKVMASGVQIGFVVAEASVIAELKKIRKLIARNPPINNQQAVAYFLSLGYYDAYMMSLHKTFFERWLTLREALNIYLPNCIDTGPIQGGTAYWVTGPKELDGEHLREKAAELGILIEPVKRYFASGQYPENCFRLGVTSIPNERIRSGVAKLAELIHQLTDEFEEKLNNAKGKLLTNSQLQQILANVRLECQMVYGVPCVIELHADGQMHGHTGGKDQEFDGGRWWIEDGQFYRQWNLWGYGEEKSFYVVMDGEQMKWFDKNYCFVRELQVIGYLTD